MKRFLLCLTFFFTGVAIVQAQTIVFQQNFTNGLISPAVNGIGGYDNETDPGAAITANGTASLVFTENSTSSTGIVTNSLTSAANGNCLLIQFNLTVITVNSGSASGNAIALQLGQGLSNSGSLNHTNTTEYASFGFTTKANNTSVGAHEFTGGSNSSITADASAGINVQWMANNSTGNIAYTGPDGLPHTISPNTWDLWFDKVAAFLGAACSNNSANQINSFKVATASTQSTFRVSNLTIQTMTSNATLPITFASLSAQQSGGVADIHWNTGTEHNMDHFQVARSTDGEHFTVISEKIPAQNVPHHYHFQDAHPFVSKNFYQIMAIHKNGEVQKSAIVQAQIPTTGNMLNVYPNPAHNYITVTGAGPIIELFNSSGKLVLKQDVAASTVQVNMNLLPKGVYLLRTNGQHTHIIKQ